MTSRNIKSDFANENCGLVFMIMSVCLVRRDRQTDSSCTWVTQNNFFFSASRQELSS